MAFFADEGSEKRQSRYQVVAPVDGTYILISYKDLLYIACHDHRMMAVILDVKEWLAKNKFPKCDFFLPTSLSVTRDMRHVFQQNVRKVILINRRQRSKLKELIQMIRSLCLNKIGIRFLIRN